MAEVEDDQRTERATPRRRSDARERGQVAFSTEIVAALLLVALALALVVGGGRLALALGWLVRGSAAGLAAAQLQDWTTASSARLVGETLRPAIAALALFLGPIVLVGFLAGYGQVGFQIAPKAIEVDFAKLDPARGWRRIFSAGAWVRVALALAKLVFLFSCVGGAAWMQFDEATRLADGELGPVLAGSGRILLRCALAGIAGIAVLAVFDFAFQRWQHERNLRMTRQEVREELRNMEGDPHIRARVRRVQRELARRRMMADVPKASVVITNPTHFAVALRYERKAAGDAGQGAGGAPRVVAKGTDRVAARIREIAREAGVPIHEDAPLARALHAQCEIGDEIPASLYQAVAGVLAYLYRRREGARVPAPGPTGQPPASMTRTAVHE